MNDILTEKEFQHFIIDYLKTNSGYIVRNSKDYNRQFALDEEILFQFLYTTQKITMEKLEKIYKDKLKETLISYINNEITKKNGSLINVLRNGIEINNNTLYLMYSKPATTYNIEAYQNYESNIFSIMQEVEISEKERIDLVIFLNGFAIITFELKCNHSGQSYEDAIYQYRTSRDEKNRLFLFKVGALVHFAMDLCQVYMTTKLKGMATFFLPFNMGSEEGINSGAGNPVYEDKYSVYYMWEDILTKDTLLDLIKKFIFIEVKSKEDENGKIKYTENLIFPRYHQLDAVRKLLIDTYTFGTENNYLIQHSAGSGKTNTIAWLAHRLASLHNENNQVIFNTVIITTDRIVVDRQLQNAIKAIEHKSGLVRVMDDSCTSNDLADALNGNSKIIVTTIHKFNYIVDIVQNLKNKTFAIIIDEAHSSTSGRMMISVTKSLTSENKEEKDMEDLIAEEIEKSGKQPNISMFAFTATPKAKTLRLFGRLNKKGHYKAFHLYSMKQAIEEGFILDVLQNYITYDTYFKLNKTILDDPLCKIADAKRKIARFIQLHDENIAQKIEIIIEHFRHNVMHQLNGMAKAMVVTSSRMEAVKYKNAFEKYIQEHQYDNIKALVAFSGKLNIDGIEYSEAGINNITEDKLPNEFNKDEYKVLLVANKYQTGFDQPKLCAMYIIKHLSGVSAVQTLSRLNRIMPPYEKKTFILDFANKIEDIVKAFEPYYTATVLSASFSASSIYDLETKIDAYCIFSPNDIEEANKILYSGKITSRDKKQLTFLIEKAKREFDRLEQEKQKECIILLKSFINLYEFLMQASCFEDIELHKKYRFITYFVSFINIRHSGNGFDLEGKIKATDFVHKKTGEYSNTKITPDPVIKLPVAERLGISPEKEELLSKIIEEINARTGKTFDSDVALKSILQIKDILLKSDDLKLSAKNNTRKDFEFALYSNVDKALLDGFNQNNEFFQILLSDEALAKEVIGIFSDEIYNSLRDEESKV